MKKHLMASSDILHKDQNKDKKKLDKIGHTKKAIALLVVLAYEHKLQKYPSLPKHAIPKPKYSDKTANGLTRCIIDFLKLKGWQAERISIQGRYIDRRKIVKNVLGQSVQIGSAEWIPSSMQVGAGDISATIRGFSVKVEVKMRDKQSEAQRIYQSQVERAGGTYLIARNFQGFYDWYIKFCKS